MNLDSHCDHKFHCLLYETMSNNKLSFVFKNKKFYDFTIDKHDYDGVELGVYKKQPLYFI